MDYDRVVLVKNEVFVYKIPPRQSNKIVRASEWSLDKPDWIVRLRAISCGSVIRLRLENSTTGELFAECPIDEFPGIAYEPVTDSSRYFVIRLKSDNGQTTFVGIGFADRSDSFDLNTTIQDHFRSLKQEKEAETLASQPSIDLSLKEGERIKLNLNIKRTGNDGDDSGRPRPRLGGTKTTSNGSTTVPLLLPPPPSSSRQQRKTAGSTHQQQVPTSQALPQSSDIDLLKDLF